METKTLIKLDVELLSIKDLHSLINSTLNNTKPFLAEIDGNLRKAYRQLDADNKTMGIQIKMGTRNMLTLQLAETDIYRDDLFAAIKRRITSKTKSSDKAENAAAASLKNFMGPYWNANFLAMNLETVAYAEMINSINSGNTLKMQAATIGITGLLSDFESANIEFEILYNKRKNAKAVEGPSAASLKSAVIKSYRQFYIAFEKMVNFSNNPKLEKIIEDLNELNKTYHRQLPTITT